MDEKDNKKYICYSRFRGTGISGLCENIPYGTELESINGVLYNEKRPICYSDSDVAHRHFSMNDDGHGLERGRVISKIIYRRNIGPGENEDLIFPNKWKHFFVNGHWLSERFYSATLNELCSFARDLHIKV